MIKLLKRIKIREWIQIFSSLIFIVVKTWIDMHLCDNEEYNHSKSRQNKSSQDRTSNSKSSDNKSSHNKLNVKKSNISNPNHSKPRIFK